MCTPGGSASIRGLQTAQPPSLLHLLEVQFPPVSDATISAEVARVVETICAQEGSCGAEFVSTDAFTGSMSYDPR
jgi:hypothetical protein